MLKAVILVGGIQKGTRFRPLSLDCPKPLFPVAGVSIIQHHVEACIKLKELKEILIIGSYPASEMQQIGEIQAKYDVKIRYLQEFTELGTGGGIYHFRDQIRSGNTEAFFVLNGDVCSDFPLNELYEYHKSKGSEAMITIMSTEATRNQSLNYGCLVTNKIDGKVTHYVEKPNSYVSTEINCGVYICSMDVFPQIAGVFYSRQNNNNLMYNCNGLSGKDQGHIQWEQEILTPLAGTGRLFALSVTNWWSQVKTAGSAIYANRHYLELSKKNHPERFSETYCCNIVPNVYIHPSATVHPTATLGPNVSIGSNVSIGPGVRIRESIILDDAVIGDHSLVIHSIVGRKAVVGQWSRVEGTPGDPDPNKPFTKMENPPLFNSEGKLNPSITILGYGSNMPSEMILLNSIVLPHKELTRSFKNEIIL